MSLGCENTAALGQLDWSWKPLVYILDTECFIELCAIEQQSRRSAYEDCALIKCSAQKVIYSVLYVNPNGTQITGFHTSVCTRVQSKPRSDTGSGKKISTLEVSVTTVVRQKMHLPDLLFLFFPSSFFKSSFQILTTLYLQRLCW